MDPLYALGRSLLFRLDAERAHTVTVGAAARVARSSVLLEAARRRYGVTPDEALGVDVAGLHFESPIGLAAGMDKDGVAIDFWAAIGFGSVEVGTVTPGDGQPGNDRPRLQRLVADRALVNRMGFNNAGAEALARRLAARRTRVPVGANLGKAKSTPLAEAAGDYVAGLRAVWRHCDYIAVNVSSPNTPGLRDLQAVRTLEPLLSAIVREADALAVADASNGRRPPLFLKVAPDLADEDLDEVADLARSHGVNGLIATNTTIRTDGLSEVPAISGGVSGAPLTERALACTRRLFRRTQGELPIIGVGGVRTVADAYARIRGGASSIQVYTALVYEGPGLVRGLTHGLSRRLRADGIRCLADAVGVDAG